MRITTLAIAARLENVATLFLPTEFEFGAHFVCNNCGTRTEKSITFAADRLVQHFSSRSPAVHMWFKCKECRRQCSMALLGPPLGPYTAEDAPNYRPIIRMDCRGCSPVSFVPLGRFIVTAAGGSETRWNDVELDIEGEDWAEYDENNGQAVGIFEFKYRFESYKK